VLVFHPGACGISVLPGGCFLAGDYRVISRGFTPASGPFGSSSEL